MIKTFVLARVQQHVRKNGREKQRNRHRNSLEGSVLRRQGDVSRTSTKSQKVIYNYQKNLNAFNTIYNRIHARSVAQSF